MALGVPEIIKLLANKDNPILEKTIEIKEDLVLYLIHKLRCLSPKELSNFFEEKLKTSFTMLYRAEGKGYLYSEYVDFYDCKQRVFFLTNKGIERVAEKILQVPLEVKDKKLNKYVSNFYNQYENKLSETYIPHHLAQNDFYLTLLKKGLAVDWNDGRQDTLFDGDSIKAPIKVDASFLEEDMKMNIIEQDMGTSTRQRMLQKFSTYANHYPLGKFKESTMYLAINMGRELNSRKVKRLSNNDTYKENIKKLKLLRKEKRNYNEMEKLFKEFKLTPSKEEIEKEKKAATVLLNDNDSIIGGFLPQGRIRQLKAILKEVEELEGKIDKNYKQIDNEIKKIEKFINDEDFAIYSKSDIENLRTKVKNLLRVKDILKFNDDDFYEDINKHKFSSSDYKEKNKMIEEQFKAKQRHLDNKIRLLNSENDKISFAAEREELIKLAEQRKESLRKYIDYHILNTTDEDDTLMYLFKQGFNLYMDESINLAEFAYKRINKISYMDFLIQSFKNMFLDFQDILTVEHHKNIKINYFRTVVKDLLFLKCKLNNKGLFIDFFDLMPNNIASHYRFNVYMEDKANPVGYTETFHNRLTICMVSSIEQMEELRDKHINLLKNVWFCLHSNENKDYNLNNMYYFDEDDKPSVITHNMFLNFIGLIAD